MTNTSVKKAVSLLLSLLTVFSVLGGLVLTAAAADADPAQIAEFEQWKTDVKNACDSRALPGDSDACKTLIINAKNAVDELEYDTSKSLNENKSAVSAVLSKLNQDLSAQRSDDVTGICPYCGEKHSGSLIGLLHAIIYVLEKFFNTFFSA